MLGKKLSRVTREVEEVLPPVEVLRKRSEVCRSGGGGGGKEISSSFLDDIE